MEEKDSVFFEMVNMKEIICLLCIINTLQIILLGIVLLKLL